MRGYEDDERSDKNTTPRKGPGAKNDLGSEGIGGGEEPTQSSTRRFEATVTLKIYWKE